jgi:hypothetical protein
MSLYILSLVAVAGTLVAHLAGIDGLYFSIPLYDVFMHILGGVGIGLLVGAIIKSDFDAIASKGSKIVLGVLVIGIVWELFEIIFNVAGYPLWSKAYFLDTVKDLFDDCLGGLIAFWVVRLYK